MNEIEDRSKVNSIIEGSSAWKVPTFEVVYKTANYGEYQKVKELFENQEAYERVTKCKQCKYFQPDNKLCEITLCAAEENGYCYWAEEKHD